MKIKTICFSPTGNTKKAVKCIADGIKGDVSGIDLTMPFQRKKEINIDVSNLVIVGMPVYGGRIPQLAIPAIKRLDGSGKKAVAVVTYGNRDYDDALLELTDLLQECGFEITGAVSVIGEHSYTQEVGKGRPDQKDCMGLITFGERIKEKLLKKSDNVNVSELTNKVLDSSYKQLASIKGNRPYKKIKPTDVYYGPETSIACTKCGICSNLCPTGAISENEQSVVNMKDCIHCFACVRNCPVMAKNFTDPNAERISNILKQNCMSRKEIEYYI